MPDLPPFLAGLRRHVETPRDAWIAPGHRGGRLLRRTAAGREVLDLLGRTYDVDTLLHTHALGDPALPTDELAAAEAGAARVWGAERCRFVTNGTSTANRVVMSATVAPGDRVLLDANCHKSVFHAAALCGADVTILPAARTSEGLLRPPSEGDVPDASAGTFALAVVTNTTFDGLGTLALPLFRKLGRVARFVHFDEAWLAHAAFAERYSGMHATSLGGLADVDPAVIVTMSMHKSLGGLCQTSQILVSDAHCAPGRRLPERRLDVAYRMHASTSPQFALVAALAANAAAFGECGEAWVGDALDVMADLRARVPEPWGVFVGGDIWQDPMNLTLRVPAGMTGHLAKSLLAEAGIVAERAGPGFVLLRGYPAVDGGMADRLLAALGEVAARFAREPALRERAAAVAACLDADAEAAVGDETPPFDLTPAEAHGVIARGDAESVHVDDLTGRVVASEIAAYPPGALLFAAGQRVTDGPRLASLRAHVRLLAGHPDLAPALHGVVAGRVLCVG